MENLIFEIYEKGLLDEKKYRLFLRTIKNFINSTSFSNRDKLLNIEFSFGSNDKNGNVYMISLDDKLKVLDYLEKRKIPINNLTYVTVIRRYAKGWLEVDKFNFKK